MKGYLCNQCKTFVPSLPAATLRYVQRDAEGRPSELIADLCRACAEPLAVALELIDEPHDDDSDDVIDFEGSEDDE